VYYYELRSVDEAGNSFTLPRQKIVVDAAKKNVSFKIEPTAFSPNDDGVKDVMYLNISAPKADTLLSYSLSIYTGAKGACWPGSCTKLEGKHRYKATISMEWDD